MTSDAPEGDARDDDARPDGSQPAGDGDARPDRAQPEGDPSGGPALDQAPGRARWALLLAVAAAALALDQVSKAWAVAALDDGHVVELVGSLQLRLTMNYGSAFSLANGRGPLISLLALVVVAILLRTGRHATRPAMAVALGLVLGGAFGNLIDRAFRDGDGFLGGGVVDFIDLQWWPVFNVADSAIVVGAVLLFLTQWREPAEASGTDRDR